MTEGGDVLHAGGGLEAGVEVDADAFPDGETVGYQRLAEAGNVIGADAAGEEEGGGAIVGGEDRPVKLLAAAADGRAFGVKKEVVHKTFVHPIRCDVITTAHTDGLDNWETYLCYIFWRFVTMKLDIVEGIVISCSTNLLQVLVHKHTDALALCWQVGWTAADIAAGLRPEDKAHPIRMQGLYGAYVFGIAHAANLNNGFHGN